MPPDKDDTALAAANSAAPPASPQDTAAAASPSPDTPSAAAAPAEVKPVETAAPAAAETKPAAPAIPEPEPTLLETLGKEKTEEKNPDDKAAEAKPAQTKPEAKAEAAKPEDKPAEQKVDAPKLEPVAYEYTLPDTLKMSDEQKGEFNKALDGFRADPVKGVQGLIDLHNKLMGEFAENQAVNTLANQHKAFAETRKGWRTKLMADSEMGGAAFQTTSGAVARMRDLLVSTAKEGSERYNQDHAEFNEMLRVTGAGDHPAFWRTLHNAARWLDEPAVPPPDGKPAKGNGKNPRRSGIYSEESVSKMNQ